MAVETEKGGGLPAQDPLPQSESTIETSIASDGQEDTEPVVTLKTWIVSCVCLYLRKSFSPCCEVDLVMLDPLLRVWPVLLASAGDVGHWNDDFSRLGKSFGLYLVHSGGCLPLASMCVNCCSLLRWNLHHSGLDYCYHLLFHDLVSLAVIDGNRAIMQLTFLQRFQH